METNYAAADVAGMPGTVDYELEDLITRCAL
jgi:hypothetical protein